MSSTVTFTFSTSYVKPPPAPPPPAVKNDGFFIDPIPASPFDAVHLSGKKFEPYIKNEATTEAPKGCVFVCPTCGKTSKDSHSAVMAPQGWDSCCKLFSVLVAEKSIIKEGGVVRYARAANK